MSRILVVGDVMTDIIAMPEGPIVKGSDRRARVRSRPGGSGANQAVWLGALGADVAFAARVGAADRAMYENYFRGRGVVPLLAGDAELPTGVLVTILDPDGERSFLTDRGANLNLSPDDLPESVLEEVGLVLVSGYSLFEPRPREAVTGLMRLARAQGIAIAVDPASVGFLAEIGAARFLGWTEGADLLLANSAEAEALSAATTLDGQMRRLGAHFPTVVVKRGPGGAALGGSDGVRVARPAPLVEVLDSTGAGDAFAAGLCATLAAGGGEAEALDAGIAAGARAVGVLGGQPE